MTRTNSIEIRLSAEDLRIIEHWSDIVDTESGLKDNEVRTLEKITEARAKLARKNGE